MDGSASLDADAAEFTNSWFSVKHSFIAQYLAHLARDIAIGGDGKGRLIKASADTAIIRRRVQKYMFNALIYNINYKDTGNVNICHMTTFPMHVLENNGNVVNADLAEVYPLYKTLFDNTIWMNHQYAKHCFKTVLDPLYFSSMSLSEKDYNNNCFVCKLDFHYAVFYFVMTGGMTISEAVCKNYHYATPVSPLTQLFDLFLVVYAMPMIPSSRSSSSSTSTSKLYSVSLEAMVRAVTHHGVVRESRLWTPKVWKAISDAYPEQPSTPYDLSKQIPPITTTVIKRGLIGLMRAANPGAFLIYASQSVSTSSRRVFRGLVIVNESPSASACIYWCARTGLRASFASTANFIRAVRKPFEDVIVKAIVV
ncbi:hypothetical protein EGW08_021956 [Elysia chlorotica]|uniref:Uncharacterized protein n=1 Tax=Elysia chlorotica TaxID=188477 RepID=A0A433SMB1_ELYCH|nr:hypothetical protein EGW08_021956 [Elysia chlorotica]